MTPKVTENDPPSLTEEDDDTAAEQKLEEDSVFAERQDAASQLMSLSNVEDTTSFDIEHNIRSIRGILTTNKEIWDRCKPFLISANNNNSSLTFSKWGYEEIKVDTIEEKELRFMTTAVKSEKTVLAKILFSLPAGLDILPPQYIETEGALTKSAKMIDFDTFFKKSLVLHDSVLEPFLAKLKTHLEEVQVCLGEIDEWLMMAQRGLDFIECTFAKKLELPPTTIVMWCNGSHQHSPYQKCESCSYNYKDHDGSSKECPNHRFEYFKCKSPSCEILKTIRVTGTFRASFSIANDNQKAKLLKFLDFITTED
eukprot:scaffold2162_cov113-Cylindrotheca_fusiformis.AAC.1